MSYKNKPHLNLIKWETKANESLVWSYRQNWDHGQEQTGYSTVHRKLINSTSIVQHWGDLAKENYLFWNNSTRELYYVLMRFIIRSI